MRVGMCFQLGAWWIGLHYSCYNKRACITLIPCITLWIVFAGGNVPDRSKR